MPADGAAYCVERTLEACCDAHHVCFERDGINILKSYNPECSGGAALRAARRLSVQMHTATNIINATVM